MQLKRCRFFRRELSEGLAGYIAGTAMARACRDAMQALRSGLLYELPGCSRGGCWGHTARLRAPSLLGREKNRASSVRTNRHAQSVEL